MVIHVTEKLRAKLHTRGRELVYSPEGEYLRWYANVFTAERTQYILTTNAATLFSVVIHGRGITGPGTYGTRFLAALAEQLEDCGMGKVFERVIAPHADFAIFVKTEDRSVLGSMNEMVQQCKALLARGGRSLRDLSRGINSVPYNAIGFRTPRETFSRLGHGGDSSSRHPDLG